MECRSGYRFHKMDAVGHFGVGGTRSKQSCFPLLYLIIKSNSFLMSRADQNDAPLQTSPHHTFFKLVKSGAVVLVLFPNELLYLGHQKSLRLLYSFTKTKP